MAQTVTDKDFEDKVAKAKGLVLVDFWADWCGPCHALAPVIDKIADETKDTTEVYKLNVDENQKSAMDQKVMGIPTVKLFKDGEVVETLVGVRSQREYMEAIEKHKN